MKQSQWEGANNCDAIRNHFSFMTVQQAAALWCGIPKAEIDEQLGLCAPYNDSTEYGKSVLKHPFVPCLEPRCRVLQDAIDNDLLKVGRDGGKTSYTKDIGHVAYSRRTLNISDLKDFIRENFPSDMPKTLFDELERSTHKAITKEAYVALQADRDALKSELDRLKLSLTKANSDKETLILETEHLKKMIDTMTSNNGSKSQNYLIVIAAMLEGIKSARKKKGLPTSGVQSSLIESMLESCVDVIGISESSLQKVFAEANKAIDLIKNKDLI